MDKKTTRLRRSRKSRAKMRQLGAYRLCVYRSSKHIYAQIISPEGDKILASASTVQSAVSAECKYTGNIAAAAVVGATIAKAAKDAGVSKVAFDRSGFKYHGRVKALADAAREHGLEF